MNFLARAIALIVVAFLALGGSGLASGAVTPPPLALTTIKTEIIGGNSASVTIKISPKAGPAGRRVALTASNSAATVPTSVLIKEGGTSASVKIPLATVTADKSVTITASYSRYKATLKIKVLAPQLSKITLPLEVITGRDGTGTVTLTGNAAKDLVVTLKTSNSKLSVDNQVVIPKGQKSGKFSYLASIVTKSATVTFSATLGDKTLTQRIVVRPPELESVSLYPKKQEGGYGTALTVKITAPAPTGGVKVMLASLSSRVIVPASVTIPKGLTSQVVPVQTLKTNAIIDVPITADQGAIRKTAILTVGIPTAHVDSITIDDPMLIYKNPTSGVVWLDKPAEKNLSIKLVSSDPLTVGVPSSVIVPQGGNAIEFAINVKKSVETTITITASDKFEETSITRDVVGNLIIATNIDDAINYNSTGSGEIAMAIVPASSAGQVVHLTSSDPSVLEVPTFMVVPVNGDNISFTMTSHDPEFSQNVTITMTYGPQSVQEDVWVVASPPAVSSVTAPAAVDGGGNVEITISLTKPAFDGMVVFLTSSDPDALPMPETVAFDEFSTTATFMVTAGSPEVDTMVTLTATYDTSSATTDVQVNGQPVEEPTATPEP